MRERRDLSKRKSIMEETTDKPAGEQRTRTGRSPAFRCQLERHTVALYADRVSVITNE